MVPGRGIEDKRYGKKKQLQNETIKATRYGRKENEDPRQ
jgi:hypothetical protein